MSTSGLALAYAALVLHDKDPIDSRDLKNVLKSAKLDVTETSVDSFAQLLSRKPLSSIVGGIKLGMTPSTTNDVTSKAQEVKGKEDPVPAVEEEVEEEEDDMGFGLFD